jgi:hypothetical protein
MIIKAESPFDKLAELKSELIGDGITIGHLLVKNRLSTPITRRLVDRLKPSKITFKLKFYRITQTPILSLHIVVPEQHECARKLGIQSGAL